MSEYQIEVSLRPADIEALAFVLRYVETNWRVDGVKPDAVVAKSFVDSRHLLSLCEQAMARRIGGE